jgi:hypothetical protein
MRECLDEGILQSYFDGELSSEHTEGVTSHLVSCVKCATAARELEGQISLLSSALAPEFEATVPTERLRHRIDAAIAGLPLVNQNEIRESAFTAGRGWLQSLATLFAFTPQRTLGYAGLALVLGFGAIIGIFQLRQDPSITGDPGNEVAVVKATPDSINTTDNGTVDNGSLATAPVAPIITSGEGEKKRHVKTRRIGTNQAVAQVKLLPGERSYLKTIAALDSTIKENSNRPMRPSLQAEYERNLAVVDRALAATRSAAKKNPNDPDAAEFMFSAYQSKVDLLNTVADARLYNRQP